MKRHQKHSDGLYHIGGKTYQMLIGSRAQVHHGTAYKTKGELKKGDLIMNKHGRIVSKKKHATAKRENRLEKAGYKPKKGTFVLMRKSMRSTKGKKVKKSKKGKTAKKGKGKGKR
jgi:hypothetical protein